jgi:hypothetical protein
VLDRLDRVVALLGEQPAVVLEARPTASCGLGGARAPLDLGAILTLALAVAAAARRARRRGPAPRR